MSVIERDSYKDAKARKNIPQNKFGLWGVDHFGMPTRDVDLAGRFVEDILGGVECYRAGYSEQDIRNNRLKHIFYHVGSQLVEVVEQDDGISYPDKTNPNAVNTNPHWAFGISAEGLVRFVEHLKREGIPFNGPRSHGGTSLVSVYFRDMDGNNLEITTWEPLPSGAPKTTMMGGEDGGIPWSNLSHNWRPK